MNYFFRKIIGLKKRSLVSFCMKYSQANATQAKLQAYQIHTLVTPKNHGKPTVLIIGPRWISSDAEHARLKLFEDVFRSLYGYCDIHWVTSEFSDSLSEKIGKVCRLYGVIWHIRRDPVGLFGIRRFALYQAYDLAMEIHPDVISNMSGYLTFGHQAVLIAKALGVKSVVRVPGDEVLVKNLSVKDTKNLRAREREILENADVSLVMSKDELQRVKTSTNLSNPKIVVRGIDRKIFKRTPINVNSPKLNVLFVGRNSPEKGLFLLKEIIQSRNTNFSFTIIGDFPENDPIWANAKIKKFLTQKKMAKTYKEADVLMVCSQTEGFAQTIGEALMIGRPVILPHDMLVEELGNRKFVIRCERIAKDYISKLETLASQREILTVMSKDASAFAAENLDSQHWDVKYREALLLEK